MTTIDHDAIVEALADHNDTYELPDGSALRLRIDHDEFYDPFADTDSYGRIRGAEEYALRNRDTGRYERPRDMNGNAEKLSVGRSADGWWWQPPADGPKRGTPEFAKLRALVCDLLEFGCSVVAVEMLRGEDAYGQPIVVQVAAIGGVDSIADGYLAEVVSDLLTHFDLEGKQ